MQEILIDFEVFKALTAKRSHEHHTYNDVIRELLKLDSIICEPDPIEGLLDNSGPVRGRALGVGNILNGHTGFSARGIFLPNGTKIKAIYKQKQYTATIDSGNWVDTLGKFHSSPSAAAKAITGSNVNGLRFWHVKRPTDTDWRRLDLLQ